LVFATWGTICWLPDLNSWARAITKVLRAGGELYLADAHPGFQIMEKHDGRLYVAYDYQTPAERPLKFSDATTYTGDPTVMVHQETCVWRHALSTIFAALMDAGVTITMFREHEVLPA